MTDTSAITDLPITSLKELSKGKVRSLYDIDEKTLLFATSDRISAYDVTMENGVPSKGKILTLLSTHWFEVLPRLVPSLKTHFLTLALPSTLSESEQSILRNRSMQVRRLRIFPLEAIVRGYITGGAWSEYQSKGTVHGTQMPAGLQNCQKFPRAIYTPSTKAPLGQHDENITNDQAAAILIKEHGPKGQDYADRIAKLAVNIYEAAAKYALERGIIIADTKFEFGLDEETDDIVLVDEVLTPDSSRFWPADTYEVRKDQRSFDKQFLRNWLTKEGLKGKEGVAMPDEIASETAKKYKEAFKMLTGRSWEDTVSN